MSNVINQSPNSFVDDVAQHFMQHHPAPSLAELQQWRPARSQWDLARRIQTLLSPFQKREVALSDTHIKYLIGGNTKGPTVLLLHGFGANKENWLFMSSFLTRHYRVIIPDLPGFGESSFHPELDYRLTNQAQRISHFVAAVSDEPVHVVGNSMGGAISAILAAHHGEQVASLGLMNSAGFRGSRPSLFEQRLIDGENPLIPSNYEEVSSLFDITTYAHTRLLRLFITPIIYKDFIHRSPVNHRLFSDALEINEGIEKIFEDINCPTLVLWGNKDAVLDVSCVEATQQHLPTAQVKILSNIGHLPMLESPLKSARIYKRFWQSI